MRISDWSSDVCSSDLAGRPSAARFALNPCTRGASLRAGNARPYSKPIGECHDPDHQAIAEPLGHIRQRRSEEHTSELQSLMRISYAVFCLKKITNVLLKHENQVSISSSHTHLHVY